MTFESRLEGSEGAYHIYLGEECYRQMEQHLVLLVISSNLSNKIIKFREIL